MNCKKCTFFGHRDTPDSVKPLLRNALLILIEQKGVKQFYVGNHGNFDVMACYLLTEFEQSHAIRFDVVLAYPPREKSGFPLQHHFLLPEGIETVPPRFAIHYRNRWMLEHSDVVVTYVRAPVGGAAKYKHLAEKKNKTVLELSAPAP